MIWLVIAGVLIAAVGWSFWLAQHSAIAAKLPLVVCLMIALSSGTLSQIMLWLGLLRIPITFTVTTTIYLVVMAPGFVLAIRDSAFNWLHPRRIRLHPLAWFSLAVTAAVSAAVLFNALLWPFYHDDPLSIYGRFAWWVWQHEQLYAIGPGSDVYELYPQLVTMNFAYLAMFAGWRHEYAVRFIGAVIGLGTLPATYLLARQMYNERTGWLAALFLASTLDFGRWASAGYVDVPVAFFMTFGAALTWTALQQRSYPDLLLAAAMIGLAAWTKNAALLAIAIFFTLLLYNLILNQLSLKHLLLPLAILAIVAAPWYLRNLVLAGSLTPDTVWVEEAQQTWRELLVLITLPQNYGLIGILAFCGVSWGIGQVLWGNGRKRALFLLIWAAPFYIAWLLFASYDPRFILLILPFVVVLGAALVDTWTTTVKPKAWVTVVAVIVIGAQAAFVVWNSVEFKRALLTQPIMSHSEKVNLVRPDS